MRLSGREKVINPKYLSIPHFQSARKSPEVVLVLPL